MAGMNGHVLLPNELLVKIAKDLGGDENFISLAMSGIIGNFPSFYADQIMEKAGIIVSNKCYFLTPRSWNTFFTACISPEYLYEFDCSHCYWLPGNQLCDNIVKMVNIRELSVKGTQLLLSHMIRIFQNCLHITDLDFSYQHEQPAITGPSEFENQLNGPSAVSQALEKLIRLKISTSVHDAINYYNDPWVLILKILSWCQGCLDLEVELTCSGKPYRGDAVYDLDINLERDWLHHLGWMKLLPSLKLVKRGPFKNSPNDSVRSHLLDLILQRMFTDEYPISLVNLWVHNFYFWPNLSDPFLLPFAGNLIFFRYPATPRTTTRFYELFGDPMQELGGISFSLPLVNLPNLASASGYWGLADTNLPAATIAMRNFLLAHPNLEHLSIDFRSEKQPYVSNPDISLLKLKSLYLSIRGMTREMMDEWVMLYPNIETLLLENTDKHGSDEELELKHKDIISAINFQCLNAVYLRGFHLGNGDFLPKLIERCPNLEIIHLDGKVDMQMARFLRNLDLFFQRALKLKDFRMDFKDRPSIHRPKTAYALRGLILALSRASAHIERVCIDLSMCQPSPEDLKFSLVDCLFDFVSNTEHLTALCLGFNQVNLGLEIQQFKQRITQDVSPSRPSLWIHVDDKLPYSLVPCIPYIHYHEIVLSKESSMF